MTSFCILYLNLFLANILMISYIYVNGVLDTCTSICNNKEVI